MEPQLEKDPKWNMYTLEKYRNGEKSSGVAEIAKYNNAEEARNDLINQQRTAQKLLESSKQIEISPIDKKAKKHTRNEDVNAAIADTQGGFIVVNKEIDNLKKLDITLLNIISALEKGHITETSELVKALKDTVDTLAKNVKKTEINAGEIKSQFIVLKNVIYKLNKFKSEIEDNKHLRDLDQIISNLQSADEIVKNNIAKLTHKIEDNEKKQETEFGDLNKSVVYLKESDDDLSSKLDVTNNNVSNLIEFKLGIEDNEHLRDLDETISNLESVNSETKEDLSLLNDTFDEKISKVEKSTELYVQDYNNKLDQKYFELKRKYKLVLAISCACFGGLIAELILNILGII